MQRRIFLGTLSAGLVSPLFGEESSVADLGIDPFVKRYMQVMNAPGMILTATDRSTLTITIGYGYSDVETKARINGELLFEIGSITKSFVALTLLQLRDEGKINFKKPVLDYLPWLPIETKFGPVSTHDLLTHSSGLPDALSLFLSDPNARHVQASKPGEHFHYCNLGFSILGYLIQKLDGRPWSEAVRVRIFEPLRMNSSYAVINDETKSRRPRSYIPFYGDATYARSGRLAPAPELIFENAAGSITSTSSDMALYLRMLLNEGKSIVSKESFVDFSTPYIAAPEFSPTASYGYGIGVDKLDGHTILRHTGGMVSFASSIHVDLDGGVAAFASINAMQGYRPTLVTEYAVQLLNAKQENKPTPPPPDLPNYSTANAKDYVGGYTANNGKRLDVTVESDRLLIRVGSESVPLERASGDIFITNAPIWNRFPFIFERDPIKTSVTEVAHGPDYYSGDQYSVVKPDQQAPELKLFTGRYQSESPWSGGVRIVLRKGKLWADGATELTPIAQSLFRVGVEPFGPDTVEFHHLAEGKAHLMKWNGADFWRVAMD